MLVSRLRSPLAVGLAAAVVAGAIALLPTAGHLALPGPRVVSDANIRLASCASGTSPGPIFGIACYSVSNQWAATYNSESIQLTFTVYGPLGGVSTLVIHEYYSLGELSVTGDFTGPFHSAVAGTADPVARPTRRGAVARSSAAADRSAAAATPRTAATNSVKVVTSDKAATTPRSAAARPHATVTRAGAADTAAAGPAANRRASKTTA